MTNRIRLGVTGLLFACLTLIGSSQTALGQITGNESNPNETLITPEKLSASFAEVSKRVEPAVVNIDTKGKIPEVKMKGETEGEDSDDILDFFRRQLPRRPAYAVGSGFIVDKSGYILTNFHVISDAARITVSLPSGEEYVAKVVGTDNETDLAVLKIEAGHDLPFINLGNSDQARVGDWVLAIGSPFGLAKTVTAGIISQTNRETPAANPFQRFIQTDAAINRGNSGGPLVNMKGEVIGINSQIATSTGDYNGIGFALPINEARNVYRQILQNGKVRRGYLGVLLDSVKTQFAQVYGLPEAKGAIITEIHNKKSAAATAGLLVNDVILEFNGEQVESAEDLIQKVAGTFPEESVSLTYLREKGTQLERRTVSIKLDERPSSDKSSEEEEPRKLPLNQVEKPLPPLGLTLTELTPDIARVYKLEGEKGLIVKNINPASYIADVKSSTGTDALNEGDLIQRINRQPVTDLKTFNEIAGKLKKGDAVVLHILNYNRFTRSTQMRVVQFTVQ
ncbi:MAG: Do family serine endopeptidase [Pyrinomonadaceae bacterium]